MRKFQYRKRYDPNRDVGWLLDMFQGITFQYRKRYDPNRDQSRRVNHNRHLAFQYRKRYDPNRDKEMLRQVKESGSKFQYRKRYDPNRDDGGLTIKSIACGVSIPQAV